MKKIFNKIIAIKDNTIEMIKYNTKPEIFLISKGTILSVKSRDTIKEINP